MRNLIFIMTLLFMSNFSATLSIKDFMEMRDTGYPEETEIYFSGLMSGALVVNSMAQDKFKDKLFCGPFERYDPKYHIAMTHMYVKDTGPTIAPMFKSETGKDFYQEEVATAYGLMLITNYFCESDFNSMR